MSSRSIAKNKAEGTERSIKSMHKGRGKCVRVLRELELNLKFLLHKDKATEHGDRIVGAKALC